MNEYLRTNRPELAQEELEGIEQSILASDLRRLTNSVKTSVEISTHNSTIATANQMIFFYQFSFINRSQ